MFISTSENSSSLASHGNYSMPIVYPHPSSGNSSSSPSTKPSTTWENVKFFFEDKAEKFKSFFFNYPQSKHGSEKYDDNPDLKALYKELNKLEVEFLGMTREEYGDNKKEIGKISEQLQVNCLFVEDTLEMYGFKKKDVESAKSRIRGILDSKKTSVNSTAVKRKDNFANKSPLSQNEEFAKGTKGKT